MTKRILAMFVALIMFAPLSFVTAANVVAKPEDAAAAQALFSALEFEIPDLDYAESITYNDFLYLLLKLYGVNSRNMAHNERMEYALAMGVLPAGTVISADASVTLGNALGMCIAMAGYMPEAQAAGGYPMGYVTTAHRIGLARGTSDASESSITFGSALMLLEDLGNVDMRQQTGFGGNNNVYSIRKNITAFYKYHDTYKVKGIIERDEHSSLYNADDNLTKGKIQIDTVIYNYDGEYLLGSGVVCYAQDRADDSSVILTMSPWRDDTITIESDDIFSASMGEIGCYRNGRSYTAPLKTPAAVLYNGKAFPRYTPADFEIDDGYILLIDNNNDSIYDIVHIRSRETITVSTVDIISSKIYDKNGCDFIDLPNTAVSYKISMNGSPITLSKVIAGSVLSVFRSKDGLHCEILVSTDSVSGVVSEMTAGAITIDGKEFSYNKYFEDFYLSKLNVGYEAVLSLDAYGRVTCLNSGTNLFKYGLLVGVSVPQSGLTNYIRMKIFTQDGIMKTFNTNTSKKTVVITDRSSDGNVRECSKDELIDMFGGYTAGNETLIRYELNAKGEITRIARASDGDTNPVSEVDLENSLVCFNLEGSSYFSGGGRFGSSYFIDRSTVAFFTVNLDPTLKEDQRYSITNTLNGSDKYALNTVIKAYNFSELKQVHAIIHYVSRGDSLTKRSPTGIVTKISQALFVNETEEETGIKITLCENGTFSIRYILDDSAWSGIAPAPGDKYPIAVGDIIRYTASSKGVITQLSKDFEYKTKKILYSGSIDPGLYYFAGKAYQKAGSWLILASDRDGNQPDLYSFSQRVFAPLASAFMLFDTKKTDVINPAASANGLVTSKESPETCDFVVISTIDAWSPKMYVYR